MKPKPLWSENYRPPTRDELMCALEECRKSGRPYLAMRDAIQWLLDYTNDAEIDAAFTTVLEEWEQQIGAVWKPTRLGKRLSR